MEDAEHKLIVGVKDSVWITYAKEKMDVNKERTKKVVWKKKVKED